MRLHDDGKISDFVVSVYKIAGEKIARKCENMKRGYQFSGMVRKCLNIYRESVSFNTSLSTIPNEYIEAKVCMSLTVHNCNPVQNFSTTYIIIYSFGIVLREVLNETLSR